jgi:hypothetical protein
MFDYYKSHWDRKLLIAKKIREKGECHISQKGRRIQVICPYSKQFTEEATAIGGVWKDRSTIWSFRIQGFFKVRILATAIFGKSNVKVLGKIEVPRVRS